MSKPFFFRIEAADLLNFCTDPDGEGMTLLRFAKELQKGESDIEFIQEIIDEAHNYIEKKKKAGSKGGKAKASGAKAVLKDAIAKPSTPLASSSSSTKDLNLVQFKLFWNAFADKRSREQAIKSWNKINPDDELAGVIIRGAEMYAKHRVNILAKNGTPKMAQGWLTDKRWEDENITIDADLTPQQRQLKEKGYLS